MSAHAMSDTVTIPQIRYDDLADCWDFSEGLDCVMQRRYAALGSFAAVMQEIGDTMDWYVQQYAADAKPWFSPTEILNNAVNGYDIDAEDCA
jgi:hypothetical protein